VKRSSNGIPVCPASEQKEATARKKRVKEKPRIEGNYEDKETKMGALCFTRRVQKTQVPKGFKLPHDQQKYDGLQEPELWLSDYLQSIKILGGSKATAMQSS
jgi:hypothetical protein